MELTINDLSKEYGRKKAVNHFSAKLTNGVYGLLGANGAGKTTLMRMICDVQTETKGAIFFNGKNIHDLGEKYRNILGYLPQNFGYYPNFTAYKFLMYISAIKGLPPKKAHNRTMELLQVVDLLTQKNEKIKTFSGGMKQRLGIAQALLNDPRILILDEPTNHLDISMKEVIEDAMKTFTGTILFVSHDRYLLDQVADHILEITPTGVKTYIGGFQSWLDATKKEAAAANAAAQAVETEKKKEDKQQTYRSKEQRAKAAQQRARMRQLEQQSEAMQAELDALNEEITKEEVYSDFNLMQEKCKRMDTLRTELDAALEEMILLEEELG